MRGSGGLYFGGKRFFLICFTYIYISLKVVLGSFCCFSGSFVFLTVCLGSGGAKGSGWG